MAQEQASVNEALTVYQAAAALGVSPFTIRAWIRERRIPFFKIGARIMFEEADLKAFQQARIQRIEALR